MKYLLFSILFAVLISQFIYAADSYRSDPGSTLGISEHSSSGYTITNSGTGSYFIPTKTEREFYTFKSSVRNLPGLSANKAVFDWRYNGRDWMTAVKDQGQCGSCWAFSVLGAIEARYNIQNNNPYLDLDLAEQELVSDCFVIWTDDVDNGGPNCTGGPIISTYDHIKANGVLIEDCFPYTAVDSGCDPECTTSKYTISDYGNTGINNREEMKRLLREKGPISVGMDWLLAIVFGDDGIGKCEGRLGLGGHAVVIVGYNDLHNYWIIKNSWGADWGDGGYGKIGYGECRIESRVDPTYVETVSIV